MGAQVHADSKDARRSELTGNGWQPWQWGAAAAFARRAGARTKGAGGSGNDIGEGDPGPNVRACEFRPLLTPRRERAADVMVDASPPLSGVRGGPDGRWHSAIVASTRCHRSSAPTWLAGASAADPTREEWAGLRFGLVRLALDDDLEAFTRGSAKHARRSRHRYVRACRGANPNGSDCMANGVAKTASATLLFMGNDLSQSDTKPAPKT
jgi:uncharacterized protein with PIN domain